jgi:UDP-N-acetylglucosamine 1-carboxyvinyltransferase
MECLRITGGQRLHGTVRVSGSKNAALPILAASILANRPVTLAGVPELNDVALLRQLLVQLGLRTTRTNGASSVQIETIDSSKCRADHALVRRMRASFCVAGPLLAARGKAVVSLPGGCNLGLRPIDLHLRAFEQLGAEVQMAHGYVIATAKQLRGTKLCMLGPNGPTVTGTANAMCAATRAKGTTVITGAAREPEIVNLADFLKSLGVQLDGAGSDRIVVQGCTEELAFDRNTLNPAPFSIIPDRIEAGTILLATAIAGGAVCLQSVRPDHLTNLFETLDTTGASLEVEQASVKIVMNELPRHCRIVAQPYPGIPTDLQALWIAVLSRASGLSRVSDEVFPQRFLHAAELCRMGADISVNGNTATIRGTPQLHGAEVHAGDLRAAAALVLAGLSARGITTVTGLEHLDRGYERLEDKLRSLGAEIDRTPCSRNLYDVKQDQVGTNHWNLRTSKASLATDETCRGLRGV